MELSDNELVKNFIDKPADREEILQSLDTTKISDLIVKYSRDNGLIIWNTLLKTTEDEKEIFKVAKNVLPNLNRDQLSLRQLSDYLNYFCIELPKKTSKFCLKIGFLCVETLVIGDQRAVFVKDVLPICLQILQRDSMKMIEYKGENKSGKNWYQDLIDSILKKPFQIPSLTILMSTFKDIELEKNQQEVLITKVSECFGQVKQEDIANLALVTFQKSQYNQMLVPLLALDKYFYKHRYRMAMNELDSSPDDIDETSTEETVRAEETVIYHFQNIAEYTSMEKDLTNAIKELEHTPKFILCPFFSTILVSIAKISSSVEGNFRLNQSTILPLVKQLFKNNEEHRNVLKISGWAQSIERSDPVNTDCLLRMLKENTCGLKQDLALNGLFGLTFLLLKTKASPALNKFAIDFLNDIIRNRDEFTSDIMHIIVKMLFCEKNKSPIIECFSVLVLNHYLDIEKSEPALKKLLEDLTELDLNTALAIESVIFTAITKSITLRDLMIEIMKKAMYQRNVQVKKMAIFSFCIMLRKFTKPTRSNLNQPRISHNISMFSLTQSQIAISSHQNIRQAQTLMLEILGLLRKCFSESSEIKVMLYECLLNSISTNTFIISNVFEFLDGHFRTYFDCDDDNEICKFDKIFKTSNDGKDFIVMDDLGYLLKFMINCIIMTLENRQKLNCDINIYEKILSKLITKASSATMDHLHSTGSINAENSVIISQFLNCLEILMIYCHYHLKTDEENATRIVVLFEKHEEIKKKAQKLIEVSKKAKTSDKKQPLKKIEVVTKCIWELKDCVSFLKVIFGENMNERANEIKQNKRFCQFVLHSSSQNLSDLQNAQENSKIKYSRSMFESFLSYSLICYEQFDFDVFKVLYEQYSAECAVALTDVFKNIIQVMETTYHGKREKWNQFLKSLAEKDLQDDDKMLSTVIERIHKLIEWGFEIEKKDIGFISSTNGSKMMENFFTILQVLYTKYSSVGKSRTSFNWILNFCKKTNVKNKQLSTVVLKLFFQTVNQHENALLIDCIAHKIASCYQYRRTIEEPENASQNNFAIISKNVSADDAFIEFIEFLKLQIHVVEIYVKRANSFNAHANIKGQDSHNDTVSCLESLEMAICTKLISLGKSMERLVSSNFPVNVRNLERIVSAIKIYYTCNINVMKHFRKHHDIKKINYQCIAIEELIKYSKKFACCVYGLAPYIESMADDDYNSSKDKKEIRIKRRDAILNKETKCIPRMIFLVETFNQVVLRFDTSAKTAFSKLLHQGEVRDFHIKNKLLNDAITSSQFDARSQSINDEDDSSTNASIAIDDEDDEGDDEIENRVPRKRKRHNKVASSSEGEDEEPEDSISIHDNDIPLTRERLAENLRNIAVKKKSTGRARK